MTRPYGKNKRLLAGLNVGDTVVIKTDGIPAKVQRSFRRTAEEMAIRISVRKCDGGIQIWRMA